MPEEYHSPSEIRKPQKRLWKIKRKSGRLSVGQGWLCGVREVCFRDYWGQLPVFCAAGEEERCRKQHAAGGESCVAGFFVQ